MSDSIFRRAGVRRVYELLTGRTVEGPSHLKRAQVRCPHASHEDAHPSCDLELFQNVWKCHACGAGGGVADMIIAAGKARDRAEAARWLEAKLDGPRVSTNGKSQVVAEYEYCDESGGVLYVVERHEPKRFVQKVPDGRGGWRYKLDGVRRVPYRLPELLEAIARGETIFVVEGEKDAETLVALGLCATTSAQGAAWRWPEAWSTYFEGATRVVVIPDCDEPGRNAALQRAALIATVCGGVRLLDLAPERSDGYDVSDWLAEGHATDELPALAESAKPMERTHSDAGRKTSTRAPRFIRAHDLLAESDETNDLNFVVDGLLVGGGTAILAGRPKGGKSTLALNLSLAVARGDPFLQRSTRKGAVLYLALEGARGGWRSVLRRLGADGDDVWVCVERAPDGALQWLREAIAEHSPALVIIDPLQRLLRVRDSNDYGESSNVFDAIIELARESSATLLFVHHSGKTHYQEVVDEVMGSTAWAAGVDTVLVLRRNERYRTITSEQRFGEPLEETVLDFDHDTLRIGVTGSKADADVREMKTQIIDAAAQFIREHPAEYPDTATILEAVEGRRSIKLEALKAAVADGDLVIQSGSGKKGDPYRYGFGSAVPDYTQEREN